MATAKKVAPKSTAPAAKSAPATPAKKSVPVKPKAEEVVEEVEAEAVPRTRGPRGVAETAVITLLVDSNPKREGSKANAVFSHYESGQTIAEFCAALEATDPEMVKEATPNLVYDAKHGFIEIEGYEVPGGVVVKEAKEPKAPKAVAAKTGKKVKAPAADTKEVEDAAEEETID